MGVELDTRALLAEIRDARNGIVARDRKTAERIDELERSVNEILVGQRRPGGESYADNGDFDERKSAITMCQDRRSWSMQKSEGGRWLDYTPGGDEIEEALGAQRAFRALLRNNGDFRRLDHFEQKSLLSLAFGNNGWAVPTTFSSRVLSCLTDPTDFLSLLAQETISGASITFPFDNSELDGVGWACEAACDGPVGSIPPPGQIEFKPETLRSRVCATSDILEDASFSVETWLSPKVERAFRQKLSEAFVSGTGVGMPQGILHPASGIPICDVNSRSPAGQWSWQDLAALKWQLDPKYAANATFLMNNVTLGLCMSMSDVLGRPIWSDTPAGDVRVGPGWMIAGSPVRVVSQMPNPEPGSTPVLVADLSSLYQVVSRRGVTFSSQPAGWCSVLLFSMRIGGAVICANAGRLMPIQ